MIDQRSGMRMAVTVMEYSVPEIAQMAFLSSGGPQRDTLLLDADGDGFACSWVPIR